DEGPQWIDTADASAGEQADAGEPGEDAQARDERDPNAEEGTVDDRHEERHARDDQRGEARGHVLLGERDGARLDDEQKPADERSGAPLPKPGPVCRDLAAARRQIGRASCRERLKTPVAEASLKKIM